jgi:hypothetical protein
MVAEQTTANKIAHLVLASGLGKSGNEVLLDMETPEEAESLFELLMQLTEEEVPHAAT